LGDISVDLIEMNRILLKIQVLILLLLLKIPLLYSQPFVEQTSISLPGVSYSSAAWGDYDNDGDLDIILSGSYTTKIYKNNGNNTFSEQTGISIIGIASGSVNWGDYDNDGDLDILLTGWGNNDQNAIYRNNGDNTFTAQTSIFPRVAQSSAAWGDYDNDGDLDFILTGLSGAGQLSKIYRNNGDNSFTEQNGIVLSGVVESAVTWGDYDNDGDLDILVTGSSNYLIISQIYRNNGDNTFTWQEDITLVGVENGSTAWGDYDNDGDLDILLTGTTISGDTSIVYRNNNDNSFTLQTSINLAGVSGSSVAWGDYDNDGDLDILLTGSGISRIYRNNGDNSFSWQEDIALSGVKEGSAAWGDYDNDGDLDILLTGSGISKIYRNDLNVPNIKPAMPSNLQTVINNGIVTFTWDKAIDTETPQNGLSYNLYVYESGESVYESSPHAFKQSDAKNGRRLIAKLGNIQWRLAGYTIKDLTPDKTYYWTIQAIDAGLLGSNFSEEKSFTIPFYRPVTQANCISFDNIQANQVKAKWASGGGTKRAVFIKAAETGIADPVDNITYDVNNLTPDGWRCVYNGTANSAIVTGLIPNTIYSLQVCEFNGATGNEKYLKSVAYQNPTHINTIFSEQNSISLPGVYRSSVVWGDYNNDGNLDLLIAGLSSSHYISQIFKNNGNNSFSEQTSIGLAGVWMGSTEWGDYDNDGDLDILLTGWSNSGVISKIYRNNGNNSFTEQTTVSLPGVSEGSGFWGDFDNDGDLDILLKGFTGSSLRILKLYRNDGDGSFTEQTNTVFAADPFGSVAIGDYDNDNDLDILLTGSAGGVSKIYRNDGDFNFTQQTGIVLKTVSGGSAEWGDYNNDGNQDLLVTGSNYSSSGVISTIYKNNGNNTFSEQTNISLTGVESSSVVWGDYNNDGFLDILLTGNSSSGPVSKIYRNNGDDTFTEQKSIILTGVNQSSVAWGDYDNDGDLDLVLTGVTDSGMISKIYRNESLNLNVKPTTPGGLQSNWDNDQIIFKWNRSSDNTTPVKGLNYNLRIGTTSGGSQIKSGQSLPSGKLLVTTTSYFLNDTCFRIKLPCDKYYWSVQAVDKGGLAGNFAGEQITSSDSIQAKNLQAFIKTSNSLFIRWTNGNGIRRILFARISSPAGTALPVNGTIYHPEPYFGKGDKIGTSGWFCIYNGEADSTTVYGLGEGYSYDIQAVEYVKINGVPVYFRTAGSGNPGNFSATLFSEQAGTNLPLVGYSSVAWSDYDNDGDLDVLLTGSMDFFGGNPISRIYRNNGNNTFTEQTGISLTGVYSGAVAWGDYDNDGNLDIILTGYSESEYAISKIYHNNGDNSFTEQTSIVLTGVCNSSVAWSDYNNDGYLDILLTGSTDFSNKNPISKIYRNNGNNTFSEQTGIVLPGILNGSAAWGDYNNDGNPDILLAGDTGSGTICKIYCNNGDNAFFEQSGAFLTEGSDDAGTYAVWIDYDNDGNLDICLGGSSKSEIYRNNGDNSFTEQTNISLTGVYTGSISPGDYDNDGDMDVLICVYWGDVSRIYHNNGNNTLTELKVVSLISGLSSMWGDYDNDGDLDLIIDSRIYRNNTVMKAGNYPTNKKPSAPVNLLTTAQPNSIKLSWSPVRDDETSYKTMTYNIRIGSTKFGSDMCIPQADSLTGFRRVVAMGNAQQDTTFLIKNLSSGKYFWSVQAVDQGYAGGAWSAVDSFEVRNIQAFYSYDEVCLGYPTHFTDQSVATDGIASWKWDFKDGTTSSVQNPSHTYSASGTYIVKLVITDNTGVKDSLEQNVIVRPKPLTGFSAPAVCQGVPVTATNTTNNNGLTVNTWYWDFGDGGISTDQQPAPHGYLNAGNYTVKLKAIASNGCADSVIHVVSVGAYPIAAVTANAPLAFCKGDSVTLSVPYDSIYIYNWMVGGISLTGGNTSGYVAKLTGNYSVKIVNPKGNCATTSSAVSITAQEAPVAPFISASKALEFCQGDSVELSVINTLNYIYQWKLNGGAIGLNSSKYTAKNSGTYTLTVSNASGCSVNSTNSVNVTVNPAPSAGNISLSGPATFCQGGSVTLSVPATTGYSYNWRNEYGLITGAGTNSYTATASETYKLEISNTSGCTARTSPVKITVRPSPDKPVLAATNYKEGVCPGDNPMRLSAGQAIPGYSYQWIRNGVVQTNDTLSHIEFYEQGIYKLRTAIGECTSESDTFNINLPASPDKPTIYVRGPTVWYLVCSNTTANEYRWYCNGELIEGAKSYFYVAGSKVGMYQVSVSNKQGCFTRSDIYAVPTGYTGTDDIDLFEGLSIYPNPTTGLFTIEIDNNIFGEVNIDIISEHGKALRSLKSEKATEHYKTEIDLSSQPRGFYFINLRIDKYLVTRKVILE
jgi:PKD repeat protein